MRQSLARTVAIATGLLVVGAVVVFALLQQGPADPPPPAADRAPVEQLEPPTDPEDALLARGRAVYEAQRCAACHSIAGVGSPRYPLDGVGSQLTEAEIRGWIVNPQEMRPGVRKPAYDDLSPEDLEALIALMASLKAPEG